MLLMKVPEIFYPQIIRTYSHHSWDPFFHSFSILLDAYKLLLITDVIHTLISSSSFVLAHEVIGLENVPDRGPALLVMYHGTLPLDVYYLLAKLQLSKRRRLKIIVDHFLFKLPGTYNSIIYHLYVETFILDVPIPPPPPPPPSTSFNVHCKKVNVLNVL